MVRMVVWCASCRTRNKKGGKSVALFIPSSRRALKSIHTCLTTIGVGCSFVGEGVRSQFGECNSRQRKSHCSHGMARILMFVAPLLRDRNCRCLP